MFNRLGMASIHEPRLSLDLVFGDILEIKIIWTAFALWKAEREVEGKIEVQNLRHINFRRVQI